MKPEAGLFAAILGQYRLDPLGIHGLGHWARVWENGLQLAAATAGADQMVVRLFALFHDACRQNDGRDPAHGERGAALARCLSGVHFELAPPRLALLCRACTRHTGGRWQEEPDPTVRCCWDADRLDLPRVGFAVDPLQLGTPAARDPQTIRRAGDRSLRGEMPERARRWLRAAETG